MLFRKCFLLLVVLASTATADDKPGVNPDISLKVRLEDGKDVLVKGGPVPVVLVFTNHNDQEQKLMNTEYRFAILDKDGEQIRGAVAVTAELREIILKGGATTDKPGAAVAAGKLKSGEEYFLAVGVRGLAGHVKFTAR